MARIDRAFSAFFDGSASKMHQRAAPILGTESDPQIENGGQREHHFALLFRCLMTPVLQVRFRPPK